MLIEDNNNLEDGQQIDYDICIIGGGPAAISIALELKCLKKKIVILTGGGWKETAFNQDLHKGIISPEGSHEPLHENRRRQFGGGTAVWGGRCLPFESIDFEKRDWVNDSGWPFNYYELLPYYKKAAKLVKIGDFDFQINENEKTHEIISGMDDEHLISTSIERWSNPVNFAKEYEKDLKDSEDINVYINAHALKICPGTKPDIISHIEAYMNGKRFKISAKKFILASGGLENARLLLLSSDINHPNGIGNEHDIVGRYYMAHISGTYAEINFKTPKNIITAYEKDSEGVYFRRRWRITDSAQKKNKLLNIIFFLDNPDEETGHSTPLFSSVIIAKSLLSLINQKSFEDFKKRMKEVNPKLKKHILNFIFNGWKQIPDITTKSLKRFSKRRLPSILPSERSKYWGVFFQSEQTPFRESRVTLSDKKDLLGMPRLKTSLKINPQDIESIVKSHNLFISNFRKSGAGTVNYSEEGLRDYLDKKIKKFNSNAHHIGTTRMSASEQTGVVDSNSRIYSIQNLFIAGSSVFPTGGHANPTLTLLAVSLRLAEYLKTL